MSSKSADQNQQMDSASPWEAVIGLEIHAQLNTLSKMFSTESTDFGSEDNAQTTPVSLGMPGALPVPNFKAIECAIRTGLALQCQIREISVFARKNYFYPDLPKGYQISQFDKPICEHGSVEFYLEGKIHRVSITRAHLEEDAGKSLHRGEFTLINLNRAGIPLLEIVSGPDMKTAKEAAEYARSVRAILRYLEVCDGNLEEGSLRCDCNVSVRKKGTEKLGTKVEIKNINSFRFIEKAIEFEIQRQIDCLENGEKILQETRLYDSTKNKTFAMRSKEEAHDYRYFPDPDLLPVRVTSEWIEKVRSGLPELPMERAKRFQSAYGLPEYDALVLTQEKEMAEYFENVTKISGNPKASSNWIMTEVMRELNQNDLTVEKCPISAENLGKMVGLIESKVISGKIGKTVVQEMWKSGKDPETIIKEKNLIQIVDTGAIEKIVDEILAQNPGPLADFRGGKDKLFGFFVGQVMKASKGQASPEAVNDILKVKLKG